MASETAQKLLQINLGFLQPELPQDIKYYMEQQLEAAEARLAAAGIAVDESAPAELNLLVDYAAYLYRRRDSNEPMPRSLRWAINDAQAARASEAADA